MTIRTRTLGTLAVWLFVASACVSTFDPDSVALEDDRDTGGNEPDMPEDDTDLGAECPEGEACDFGAVGVVASCQGGECVPTGCEDGLGDCNADFDTDGCETALNTIEHCGACDAACEGGNAQWVCTDAACAIDECENGWSDDDGMPGNGCELAVPPTPIVEAIDVRNHGIFVEWSVPESEAEVTAWEVAWGPEAGNLGRSRRVEGPDARSATVGPVAAEGTIFVAVRAVGTGEPPTMGEPSAAFEYDFVPAGWFNHSIGRFWTDGKFIAGSGGILAAYGHVAHVTSARGAPVPGRLQRPRQLIDVDFHAEGPQAGKGVVASFEGFVGVTENYGVTWTEGRVPRVEGEGEGLGVFGITLLNSGRIIACGANVAQSDDMGESFEPVEETGRAIYFGMDTLVVDGAEYVFCQGFNFEDGNNEPIVTWTGDGGDTWTVSQPTLDIEPRFDVAGGIHMLSPSEGFMGAAGGMWRTGDQWNTAEFVPLEGADDDEIAIFRIQIDAAGNGLAASVNVPFVYTTTDAGETWNLDTTLPELPGDDLFYPGVISLEGIEGDPFLLLSADGSIFRWDGAPDSRSFTAQRRGFTSDLVGISTQGDEILAIASNQAVLRGNNGPDSLRPEGVVANSSEDLRAAAASRAGELVVAVGNGGQLHTSRDNGRAWMAEQHDEIVGVNFVDVDVDDRGSMGFAVGDAGPNRGMVVVQLLGNPPQVQVLSPRSIDPGLSATDLVPYAVDISNDGSLVVIAASHTRLGMQHFFVGRGGSNRIWNTTSIGTRSGVRAVGLIRASTDFYAVGTDGFFVRVTDGDSESVDLPLPAGVARGDLHFIGVTFPHDRLNGWAWTANGWIFATGDGGETWSYDRAIAGMDGDDEFSGADYPHELGRIWVESDNEHALVVGTRGTIVETANGGVPNPPVP